MISNENKKLYIEYQNNMTDAKKKAGKERNRLISSVKKKYNNIEMAIINDIQKQIDRYNKIALLSFASNAYLIFIILIFAIAFGIFYYSNSLTNQVIIIGSSIIGIFLIFSIVLLNKKKKYKKILKGLI